MASDSDSDDLPSKLQVQPQRLEMMDNDMLSKKLLVFQQIKERFQPSESSASHRQEEFHSFDHTSKASVNNYSLPDPTPQFQGRTLGAGNQKRNASESDEDLTYLLNHENLNPNKKMQMTARSEQPDLRNVSQKFQRLPEPQTLPRPIDQRFPTSLINMIDELENGSSQ